MDILIQNVAKIKEAKFTINALTVVIGDNNTGKSSLGRSLYSIFHGLNGIGQKIGRLRNRLVFAGSDFSWISRYTNLPTLMESERELTTSDVLPLIERAVERNVRFPVSGLRYHLQGIKNRPLGREEMIRLAERVLHRIKEVKRIGMSQLIGSILFDEFYSNFNGQPVSLDDDCHTSGRVCVETDRLDIDARFSPEFSSASLNGEMNMSVNAWYVGSPLLINAASAEISHDVLEEAHRELISLLRRRDDTESLMKQSVRADLAPAMEIITKYFSYGFEPRTNQNSLRVLVNGLKEPLKASNLSMGLKSFALIRLMLERLIMTKGDVLILDEPENHLHPDWQVAYAESIVLLQKCFDLKILLTTHSPYFLEALQLFSQEYYEGNKGRQFIAYEPVLDTTKRRVINLQDITDDTDKMFKKFYLAFRELDIRRNTLAHATGEMDRASNDA